MIRNCIILIIVILTLVFFLTKSNNSNVVEKYNIEKYDGSEKDKFELEAALKKLENIVETTVSNLREKVDATEKKLKQTLELGGRTQAELSTGYTQCSRDIENVRQQLIVANNTIDRLKSDNKNNTVLELELDKSKKVASAGLQDLNKIKKQYENSQSEIKKLTDLNNKLQTQLDNEVLKMSATISELDSAAIEITDLKNKNTKLEENTQTKNALNKDLLKLTEQNKELLKQSQDFKKKYEDLKKEFDPIKQKRDELEVKIDSLQTDKLRMQLQNNKDTTNNELSKQKIDEYEKNINLYKSQIKNLEQNAKLEEQNKKQLTENLNTLELENKVLKSTLSDKKLSTTDVNNENNKIKIELEEIKKDYNDRNNKIKQLESTLQNTKTLYETCTKEQNDLKISSDNDLESAAKSANELDIELKKVRAANKTLEEIIALDKSKNDDITKKLEKAKKDIEELVSKTDIQSLAIKVLENNNKDLQGDQSDVIKNSEKLRVANLELKDKLLKRDAEFKTLQETSGGSNEEIANLKLNIEKLSEIKIKLNNENTDLLSRIGSLTRRITKLEESGGGGGTVSGAEERFLCGFEESPIDDSLFKTNWKSSDVENYIYPMEPVLNLNQLMYPGSKPNEDIAYEDPVFDVIYKQDAGYFNGRFENGGFNLWDGSVQFGKYLQGKTWNDARPITISTVKEVVPRDKRSFSSSQSNHNTYATYGNSTMTSEGGWYASKRANGEWLKLDMSEPTEIEGVIVSGVWNRDSYIRAFAIQVSLDDEIWTDLTKPGTKYLTWNESRTIVPDYMRTFSSTQNNDRPGYRYGSSVINSRNGWRSGKNSKDAYSQREYIILNIGVVREIYGLVTQGCGDTDWWVTSFNAEYTEDGINWNTLYNEKGEDVFRGNNDRNTKFENLFDKPVKSRGIKIIPLTGRDGLGKGPYDQRYPPGMRADVLVSGFYIPYTTGNLVLQKNRAWSSSESSQWEMAGIGEGAAWRPRNWREGQSYYQFNLDNIQTVAGLVMRSRKSTDEWVSQIYVEYSDGINVTNPEETEFVFTHDKMFVEIIDMKARGAQYSGKYIRFNDDLGHLMWDKMMMAATGQSRIKDFTKRISFNVQLINSINIFDQNGTKVVEMTADESDTNPEAHTSKNFLRHRNDNRKFLYYTSDYNLKLNVPYKIVIKYTQAPGIQWKHLMRKSFDLPVTFDIEFDMKGTYGNSGSSSAIQMSQIEFYDDDNNRIPVFGFKQLSKNISVSGKEGIFSSYDWSIKNGDKPYDPTKDSTKWYTGRSDGKVIFKLQGPATKYRWWTANDNDPYGRTLKKWNTTCLWNNAKNSYDLDHQGLFNKTQYPLDGEYFSLGIESESVSTPKEKEYEWYYAVNSRDDIHTILFDEIIDAKYVRIIPKKWYRHPSMRIDLLFKNDTGIFKNPKFDGLQNRFEIKKILFDKVTTRYVKLISMWNGGRGGTNTGMRADVITTGLYDDQKQYLKYPLNSISNTETGEDIIIRIAFKQNYRNKGQNSAYPVYLYKGADLKTAFTRKSDSYKGPPVNNLYWKFGSHDPEEDIRNIEKDWIGPISTTFYHDRNDLYSFYNTGRHGAFTYGENSTKIGAFRLEGSRPGKDGLAYRMFGSHPGKHRWLWNSYDWGAYDPRQNRERHNSHIEFSVIKWPVGEEKRCKYRYKSSMDAIYGCRDNDLCMGITISPPMLCGNNITKYELRKGLLVDNPDWPNTTWSKTKVKHIFPRVYNKEYRERVYNDEEVKPMSKKFEDLFTLYRGSDIVDLWDGLVNDERSCFTGSSQKSINSFKNGIGPLKNISKTTLGTDLTLQINVYNDKDEIIVTKLYKGWNLKDILGRNCQKQKDRDTNELHEVYWKAGSGNDLDDINDINEKWYGPYKNFKSKFQNNGNWAYVFWGNYNSNNSKPDGNLNAIDRMGSFGVTHNRSGTSDRIYASHPSRPSSGWKKWGILGNTSIRNYSRWKYITFKILMNPKGDDEMCKYAFDNEVDARYFCSKNEDCEGIQILDPPISCDLNDKFYELRKGDQLLSDKVLMEKQEYLPSITKLGNVSGKSFVNLSKYKPFYEGKTREDNIEYLDFTKKDGIELDTLINENFDSAPEVPQKEWYLFYEGIENKQESPLYSLWDGKTNYIIDNRTIRYGNQKSKPGEMHPSWSPQNNSGPYAIKPNPIFKGMWLKDLSSRSDGSDLIIKIVFRSSRNTILSKVFTGFDLKWVFGQDHVNKAGESIEYKSGFWYDESDKNFITGMGEYSVKDLGNPEPLDSSKWIEENDFKFRKDRGHGWGMHHMTNSGKYKDRWYPQNKDPKDSPFWYIKDRHGGYESRLGYMYGNGYSGGNKRYHSNYQGYYVDVFVALQTISNPERCLYTYKSIEEAGDACAREYNCDGVAVLGSTLCDGNIIGYELRTGDERKTSIHSWIKKEDMVKFDDQKCNELCQKQSDTTTGMCRLSYDNLLLQDSRDKDNQCIDAWVGSDKGKRICCPDNMTTTSQFDIEGSFGAGICKNKDYKIKVPRDENERWYSSVYQNAKKGTGGARSTINSDSAWYAGRKDNKQWMYIRVGDNPENIAGVKIQGRKDAGSRQSVTSFKVSISDDANSWDWVDDEKEFIVPVQDRNTINDILFENPVKTKFVRIHPQKWERYVSMRADVIYATSKDDICVMFGDQGLEYSVDLEKCEYKVDTENAPVGQCTYDIGVNFIDDPNNTKNSIKGCFNFNKKSLNSMIDQHINNIPMKDTSKETYTSSTKVKEDFDPNKRKYCDKRMLTDIKQVGTSPSGLNIYNYKYIKDPTKSIYQGVIAQDLIEKGMKNAIDVGKRGYYLVDYKLLDTEFKKL